MKWQYGSSTAGERRVGDEPGRIAAMTRTVAIEFFRRHGHWPNAAEYLAALVVEYAEFGVTWDEAARWLARAELESVEPCGGPGVQMFADGRYRAVPALTPA